MSERREFLVYFPFHVVHCVTGHGANQAPVHSSRDPLEHERGRGGWRQAFVRTERNSADGTESQHRYSNSINSSKNPESHWTGKHLFTFLLFSWLSGAPNFELFHFSTFSHKSNRFVFLASHRSGSGLSVTLFEHESSKRLNVSLISIFLMKLFRNSTARRQNEIIVRLLITLHTKVIT